jgi:hypothetical protein
MDVSHVVNGKSSLVILLSSALLLGLAGCDGGVGEAVVADAACDAGATAATEVVTESAITGSTDIALDLGGEIFAVEPLSTALDFGDSEADLVLGASGGAPDGTMIAELNSKTTGAIQMIALTTRSIFQAEAAYLDVRNKRLLLKAVETRGAVPTWGQFALDDKVVRDLQQSRTLKFTGTDGNPKVFQIHP